MKALKIVIIGAGSTYTPELIDGLVKMRDTLPVKTLVLMDIDARKLTIVGNLCVRMLQAEHMPCDVILTEDLEQAVRGATFVVTQIRVGKLAARIRDEKIPTKYHLLGQETTGIGGFMKAQRTIPAMCRIVDCLKKLAPDAFLINFSNPAGIVTQAMQQYGFEQSIGLCNVPVNMIASVQSQMNAPKATVEYVGLNHLSWITRVWVDGQDVTEKAIANGVKSEIMKNMKESQLDAQVTQLVGAIYSPYLEYFYDQNRKIAHGQEDKTCRGEDCLQIEEELLALYSQTQLCQKPALLDKRGGHRYSEVAISLINAIYNNTGETCIVNVANRGVVDFLNEDDVVEVACKVDAKGAHPLPLPRVENEHIRTLMASVKEYERQTVQAGLYGDKMAAMRALLVHPLLGDYPSLKACLEAMINANIEFLPQYQK